MSTQEYYIRKAQEADARGPFTLEQLASLAENGQVDAETFYYDATTENWTAVADNSALFEALFPVKKSLRVKAKDISQVRTLNVDTGNEQPITVGDMLLAAQGRTEDTLDSADPAIAQARAAGIGLYAAMSGLFLLAAAFVLPHIDILFALDIAGLIRAPIALVGLLNLALGVCLALSAVGSYPVVRFASMLTFGYLGTLAYLEGNNLLLGLSGAAGVGIYLCTIFLNLPGVIVASALAIIGSGGLAVHFFTN